MYLAQQLAAGGGGVGVVGGIVKGGVGTVESDGVGIKQGMVLIFSEYSLYPKADSIIM